jgi:transposase
MIMSLSVCPYCQNKRLYILQDDYRKCSYCKKKFSLKKVEMDIKAIEFFCNNINANKASKILKTNYRTVQNRYMFFRKLIAIYNEELHYNSVQDRSSYDEFYYFTNRQKAEKKRSLYEAINIIGFYSNKQIYTLLMPRLPNYNTQDDNKVYENYLKWHRISSKDSYTTPLKVFWRYLEENLKKYKGINEENFFYYLKECEFKFNNLQNKQMQILKELYLK